MLVIVGLGNPDKIYSNTYHNMGYIHIDKFATKHSIEFTKKKYNSMCGEGFIDGEKVILLKPTTYMNLSGKAVAEIISSLKLSPSQVLVIYDDIDMPLGTIRTRNNGSAGTHNGMRDIVAKLGTTEFPRIRIGIGKPQFGNLADFVLSKVSSDNMKILESNFDKVNDEIEYFIKNKKLEEKTIKWYQI